MQEITIRIKQLIEIAFHLEIKTIMNKIVIFIFSVAFLYSCEKNDNHIYDYSKIFPLDPPDKIGQIEYDLICQTFDSILVQQATDFFILPYSIIIQEIHDLDSIAYKNYIDNNNMSYNLDSAKFVDTGIKLISLDERDYLINNPDFGYTWDEFYKKYPDSPGLFTLSRIGFNTDTACAILSYGFIKPFYKMDVLNYYKLVDNKWTKTGSIGIQTN